MGKNVMGSPKKSQWGMALPMALIMLVLASLIVVPSVYAIGSLMKINSKVSQSTLAYYAADAGVADLIWKYRYGTQPAGDYQLSNINGMGVDVKLVKTSGEDYYWVASAPAGTAGNAQVYVQVRHSDGGDENLFKYAVVGLDQNVDLNGNKADEYCLVTSDDVLVIDHRVATASVTATDCVDWSRATTLPDHNSGVGVTYMPQTSPLRETGEYFDENAANDGNKSAKISITSAVSGTSMRPLDLAYANIGPDNISGYSTISLWIYSPDRRFENGELQLVLSTATDISKTSGSRQNIPLPVILEDAAIADRRVDIPVNLSGFSALQSIGISLACTVTPTINLYIDEVVATNNYPHGTIYANGNVTLDYAKVNDNVWATAGITKPTNSTIWGTPDDYTSVSFDPTVKASEVYKSDVISKPLYIKDNKIDKSRYLGPGYIVGDLHIEKDAVVTLQGTVYITGGLTISGNAYVKGAYPLVVDTLEITSKRDSKLISQVDGIPFMYVYGYHKDYVYKKHHHEHHGKDQPKDDHTVVIIDPGGGRDDHSIVSAVIFAEGGLARLSNGARLYGAVVAEQVLMEEHASVEYLSCLQNTNTWPVNNHWEITATSPTGEGTTTVLGYDHR